MAADLDTTVRAILDCVCDALTEAGTPVCSCYATVGPPNAVLCCECGQDDSYSGDGTVSGEATVNVVQVYDADPNDLTQIDRIHPCNRSTTAADIALVVTRCYPMVDEDGNMPDTDAQDEAATGMHADVETVWKALTCGCFGSRLIVRNVAVNAPPQGGCALLGALVTVEVRI